MSKRRNTALAVLALAAAAVFVLPAGSASAGSAETSNACANSVTANFSQIEVTTSGDDGLLTVAPGGATTTTGLSQDGAVPGAIFVAGYNLGLLQQGENNIPATVNTKIEATNTTQVQQTSSNAATSVTTFITDPDGTPGTGDETGTDATFHADYDDMNWTAGASGLIDYRQDSIAAWPATDANNTLRIHAVVGGFLNVIFRCAPGTVTPPDPGTVALIDPAGSFDTTQIEAENVAPTADAGADQTVDSGALVNLDGTGSSDSDGTIASFAWAQTGGTTVTLNGADTATPSFTAPTGPDTLTFELTVTDDDGATDTDTVVVNVNAPNVAPTADAGADQTVDSGALVNLDGTGSADPDGTIASFAWAQTGGTTVTLTGADTATPSFTAPTGPDTLTFELTVTDNDGATDTDTVVVNVNEPANVAPTADAGADQTVDSGALVNLDGTGSADPDGTIASFAWTQTGGTNTVTLNGANTATPSFTAPTGPDTLTFELTVTDNDGATDTDTVVINVNAPPFIDASGEVIVNGPVKAGQTAKTYVFRISNVGNVPITIDPTTEIAAAVLVNGSANGSVSSLTGTKTINPGARTRFRLRWTGTTALATGDTVEFTADVNEPGDVDTTNDADSATFGPLG